MKWMPIESAPKDGSSVIALFRDGAVQCKWNGGEWSAVTLEQHGCGCCSESDDPPTHWMPIPEPPDED